MGPTTRKSLWRIRAMTVMQRVTAAERRFSASLRATRSPCCSSRRAGRGHQGRQGGSRILPPIQSSGAVAWILTTCTEVARSAASGDRSLCRHRISHGPTPRASDRHRLPLRDAGRLVAAGMASGRRSDSLSAIRDASQSYIVARVARVTMHYRNQPPWPQGRLASESDGGDHLQVRTVTVDLDPPNGSLLVQPLSRIAVIRRPFVPDR